MTKELALEEQIPCRGDFIEIIIQSPKENHLGEHYDFITEIAKVTRVIRDRKGRPTTIRVNGFLIKIIKISYIKNIFYVIINQRRLSAEIDIIPKH